MIRFCSDDAPCEFVSISELTEYSSNWERSVIARSSKNSFVNTETELAVSFSSC